MSGNRLARLLAIAVVLPLAGPPVRAAIDWELRASWVTNDVEDAAHVATGALALRAATGDRVRFWAEVPVVRTDDPWATVRTPLGPVPLDPAQQASRRRGRAGTTTGSTPVGTTTTGWGDVRFGIGGRLVGGGARLSRIRGDLVVKAPTADADDGLGTGQWDVGATVEAERRFWACSVFGGAGWYRLGDPDWIDLRDVPEAWTGVETEPGAHGRLWSAWVEATGEAVPGAGTRAAIGLGLRGSATAHWRVRVLVGLTDATESAAVSVARVWGGVEGRRADRGAPGAPR